MDWKLEKENDRIIFYFKQIKKWEIKVVDNKLIVEYFAKLDSFPYENERVFLIENIDKFQYIVSPGNRFIHPMFDYGSIYIKIRNSDKRVFLCFIELEESTLEFRGTETEKLTFEVIKYLSEIINIPFEYKLDIDDSDLRDKKNRGINITFFIIFFIVLIVVFITNWFR